MAEIAISNLMDTFRQRFEWFGDSAKYKPSQKSIGEKDDKKQKDSHQKEDADSPSFQIQT